MNKAPQTIQDIGDIYNGMRVYIRIETNDKKTRILRGVIKVDKSKRKHLLVKTGEIRPDLSHIKKSYGPGTKILPLNLNISTELLMNNCVILC